MYFLKRLLTWWNSQTLGTQIFTARKGVKVGEDEAGQHLLPDPRRQAPLGDLQRRDPKPRAVSPDWHGWLHFTWDEPPTKAPLKHKAWEKPHQENLTGTALAYAPPGRSAGPSRWQRPTMRPGSPNDG
jgi:NADH:ubiquinone oxidoreductase subunit